MSRYAGRKAYTIHKKIYRQKTLASAESHFSLDYNKQKNAVFIVDEASMLSNYSPDGSLFGSGQLLDDLVTYVRRGAGCRLILVGDTAQLPPVGLEHSPALDMQHMQGYGEAEAVLLDDVVRQDSQSGILFNATLVRCMLEADIIDIPMFDTSFDDVEALEGGEILEAIQSAYDRYGMDETIIITRSNKRANRFNEAVRRHVLFAEEEIGSGDLLMIVKNNYHYTGKQQQQDRQENPEQQPGGTDFIANGDTARLRRIRRFEDFYGFRFAQASLIFPDYDDMELECQVLLDTLSSESPALTREPRAAGCSSPSRRTTPTFPPRRNAIKRCAKIPTSTRCRSSSPMPSPATRRKADNGAACSSTGCFSARRRSAGTCCDGSIRLSPGRPKSCILSTSTNAFSKINDYFYALNRLF